MQELVLLSFFSPALIPENTIPLSWCRAKCLAVLSCRGAGGHPITLQELNSALQFPAAVTGTGGGWGTSLSIGRMLCPAIHVAVSVTRRDTPGRAEQA